MIEFKNLSYIYSKKTPNEFKALDDVNFKIEDGTFTAIIGETGSGKSTLIQHLNALLYPTYGEVVVDDYIVTNKKRSNRKLKFLRKHVGVVFQFPEYQLFEDTIEKDVMFGPKNYKVKKEEALEIAHECLKSVGIDESYFKRSPFDLSGGEKRRVAIAGILALQPKILVLDEPTAGLDPIGAENIMKLFIKLSSEGTQIIIVTHDMNLVLNHAKQVIVLNKGKVVENSDPSTLFLNKDLENLKIESPLSFNFSRELKKKGIDIVIHLTNDVKYLASKIVEKLK